MSRRAVVLADGSGLLIAPSVPRVVAAIVDALCSALPAFVLTTFFSADPYADHVVRFEAGLPVALLLGVICWRTGGQTPGKRAVGLRAVRTSGAPVTLGWALWRESVVKLAFALPGLVPYVGLGLVLVDPLWAFSNAERRTLHDLIAGSWVVDA